MLSPEKRALAGALRRAINASELSVRTVAKRAGLPHSTVSAWQTGDRMPQPTDVARLSTAIEADAATAADLVRLHQNAETSGPGWDHVAAFVLQRVRTVMVRNSDVHSFVGDVMDALGRYCEAHGGMCATGLTPSDLRAIAAQVDLISGTDDT